MYHYERERSSKDSEGLWTQGHQGIYRHLHERHLRSALRNNLRHERRRVRRSLRDDPKDQRVWQLQACNDVQAGSDPLAQGSVISREES